jgi:DNA mismatch endonuclease (patch repair protein)
MSDIFTKSKRSQVMSRIRSSGNKETELALAKLLRRNKIIGWRRHQPIFGKPDFIFRKAKIAIFVDGCFWHSCPRHATRPKTNPAFWRKKLARNQARDLTVTRTLRAQGWKVLRLWEHDLARRAQPRLLQKIHRALR